MGRDSSFFWILRRNARPKLGTKIRKFCPSGYIATLALWVGAGCFPTTGFSISNLIVGTQGASVPLRQSEKFSFGDESSLHWGSQFTEIQPNLFRGPIEYYAISIPIITSDDYKISTATLENKIERFAKHLKPFKLASFPVHENKLYKFEQDIHKQNGLFLDLADGKRPKLIDLRAYEIQVPSSRSWLPSIVEIFAAINLLNAKYPPKQYGAILNPKYIVPPSMAPENFRLRAEHLRKGTVQNYVAELDIIIYNRSTKEVTAIAEVKSSYDRIKFSGAFSQLNRIRNFINAHYANPCGDALSDATKKPN